MHALGIRSNPSRLILPRVDYLFGTICPLASCNHVATTPSTKLKYPIQPPEILDLAKIAFYK